MLHFSEPICGSAVRVRDPGDALNHFRIGSDRSVAVFATLSSSSTRIRKDMVVCRTGLRGEGSLHVGYDRRRWSRGRADQPFPHRAGVVKLADAPDSKSGGVYPP